MTSVTPVTLKQLVLLGASLLLLLAAAVVPPCTSARTPWTVEEIDIARSAGVEVGGTDAHTLVARRRLQDGGWQRNSACYASQTCSLLNGTCLSATTYTSPTGCGTNKQESVVSYASTSCRQTGCSWGGCNSDETEVSSSWCWWNLSYDEKCCKTAYTYTCRAYLSCTWVQPRGMSVFNVANGGSWDAAATITKSPNAYIAAILDNYMYEESLGVDGMNAFTSAFAWRVAGRMGASRVWVYYYNRDTEWLFLETPTSFIVIARGTEGILSWDALLTDVGSVFSTSTSDFGGSDVWIGSGFYAAYDENKVFFLSELARFKSSSAIPTKSLWLTGHSLGGALVTLFGAYAHLNGHPVQGVITFGSPIVGNSNFKAVYPLNNRHYRYEVPDDPVPDVPGTLTLSYSSHVGILVSVPPCAASTAVTGIARRRLMGSAGDSPAGRSPKPKRRNCGFVQMDNLQDGDAKPKGKKGSFVCPSGADAGGKAAPTKKDAAAEKRGSISVAAHSILASYAANLYYCYMTSTEMTSVPAYLSITAL